VGVRPVTTPELKRHLSEIAADNKRDRVWMAGERYEELVRLCGIVESHMVSAREAAWRMDAELLKTHLGHARQGLILVLQLAKEEG
jgi:hypothetical protein